MRDDQQACGLPELITEYGRLAVEFEDTDDPLRREVLAARLAELDGVLDRLRSGEDDRSSAGGGCDDPAWAGTRRPCG